MQHKITLAGKRVASESSQQTLEYCVDFLALSTTNTHERLTRDGQPFYLSVDLDSAKWNAQHLYKDHQPTFSNAIGKIINAEKTPMGYVARVQFFPEIPESLEAYNRFSQGLNECVSIGAASRTEFEQLEPVDGKPHYVMRNAEIYELSAVWQGADKNAKVIQTFALVKDDTLTEHITPEVKTSSQDSDNFKTEVKEQAQMQAQANTDAREIMQLAKLYNAYELAAEHIEASKSVDEFKNALLQRQQTAISLAKATPASEPATEGAFSLAQLAKLHTGLIKAADLSFSAPSSSNFVLPTTYGVQLTDELNKYGADSAANRNLDRRSDLLIEKAIEHSPILNELQIFSNLNSEVEIPRNLSSLKAEFIDYGVKQDSQALSFDSVRIRPATTRVSVRITQQMMKMSDLDLERIIFDAAKHAFATTLENALFAPDVATPDAAKLDFTGAALGVATFPTEPKYADIFAYEEALHEANPAAAARAKFLMHPATLNKLRTTQREAGTGVYLCEGNNLSGFDVVTSRVLKPSEVIFGDFKGIGLGIFENLRVNVMQLEAGVILFEFFSDFGAAVIDPTCFVK